MTETAAPVPETLQYQTEVSQLLDILAHSLYTDKEIFLRELISNASDALNRVQFEMLTNDNVVDAERELAIHLVPDAENHSLTLRDSGIGMNREELITNLGTIAHSGAKAFLQEAASSANREEIIGQFGVGFYSVFMVAEEVRVTSRSYRSEDQAWTWISSGKSEFELLPATQDSRGTEITIKLKEDSDFTDSWRLQEIVRTHSDYVSFPIYLVEPATASESDDEETETSDADEEAPEWTETKINRQTAIWRQSPSEVKEEEYDQFFGQLVFGSGSPLLHVHLVTDSPVDIRTVLFIPSQRPPDMFDVHRDQGLRLYSRKILIQKYNQDMLPEYMRFVEGVVDSEDLPLNISRETIQNNPMTRQISKTLANRILRELSRLATQDPEKYSTFWTQYGMFIKGGLATDFERKDTLVPLLRFQSSKSGEEWISLDDYLERMPASQKAFYYVEGHDLASVQRSPHLDYFRAHDIEVLYFTDPIADTYVTVALPEYKEHKLVNVDGAEVEVPSTEEKTEKDETAEANIELLLERVKKVLGERVEDVQASSLLVEHPSRLVYAGESMSRAFERMSGLMGQDVPQQKRILELNPHHELIQNMVNIHATRPTDPLLDLLIEQVLDNALLLEDLHPDPASMTDRILSIMQVASTAQGD